MTSDLESTVRSARVALAKALMLSGDEDSLAEAESQLAEALTGAGPHDRVEAIEALADLAERRHDLTSAVGWLIDGVVGADPADVGTMATRALALLGSERASHASDLLPVSSVRALVDLAREVVGSPELVQLATRLSLAHGHVEPAAELSTRVERSALAQSDDVSAAAGANRVLHLLADGRTAEASEACAQLTSAPADASVALAEAMLCYVEGDLPEAHRRAEFMGMAGDFAAVAVMSLLLQAAQDTGARDTRDTLLARAAEAAAGAARNDPAGATPLLLRAQVLLERGDQIMLGRDLLETALRRVRAPEGLLWWRIQERVRSDPAYSYFRAEVAATRDQWEEVARLAQPEHQSFEATDAQQARLYELAAAVEPDARSEASLLERAAEFNRRAGDADAELRALRNSFTAWPDVGVGLTLAEALWSLSLSDDREDEAPLLVSEGLELLEQVGPDAPDESLRMLVLMWGLLLTRSESLRSMSGADRWSGIPFLVTAVRLDEQEAYGWAHLAGAFSGAQLSWPAAWAAERALRLAPGDAWLCDTAVVMELNWSVHLSRSSIEWLDTGDDGDSGWAAAIRGLVLAYEGCLDEARRLLDESTWDASWARDVRLDVRAAIERTDELEYEVRAEVDRDQEAGEWGAAAARALWLDPDEARDIWDRAVASGDESESALTLDRALIELVESDGQRGQDAILRELQTMSRRYRVLDLAELQFGALATWHAGREGLVQALAELADLARAHARALPDRPALTREIDTGEASCRDLDLEDVVRELLELADHDVDETAPELRWPSALPGAAVLQRAWLVLFGDRG